jgi:transposase
VSASGILNPATVQQQITSGRTPLPAPNTALRPTRSRRMCMPEKPTRERTQQCRELARRRAELILKVRSGLMTATAAAAELGVSRKTYYEWENRGLSAMMAALEDRRTGRPRKTVDPEKEALKGQLKDLENRLEQTEQTLRIRQMLRDVPGLRSRTSEPRDAPSKKKPRQQKKRTKNRRKRKR